MNRKRDVTTAELVAEIHHAIAEAAHNPIEVGTINGYLIPALVDAFNAAATHRGRTLVRRAVQDAVTAFWRGRSHRADLSPWCGPNCEPFGNPPTHSSADHSARTGERAGSRRDV